MEQMERDGSDITQAGIAEIMCQLGARGSINDVRKREVKYPFHRFIEMNIVEINPESINKKKNKKYHLSKWGSKLSKDEYFDISSKIPNWVKYETKRKPPTASKVIKSYNPAEIKELMMKIKKELLSVEDPIYTSENDNDAIILFRITNLSFEDDPLYQKIFQYRKGFFDEFIIYLGILDSYRLNIWSWIKKKRMVLSLIEERITEKMKELKLDPFESGKDINVYYLNNLSEWIFDGYRYYYEYKDMKKFRYDYQKPNLVWTENILWTELRLNKGLVIKVSKDKDNKDFRSNIKDSLIDFMTIRDDPLSNEFRELVRIYQRKNMIKNKMFEVLDLIIRKDYSKL